MPRGASGSAGAIAVSGAYVGDDGSSSYRPMYLTIRNAGPAPDLLEAAVSPAARSATWVVAHKVHTAAEIEAFAETCGADPQLLAESNAALARSSNVYVPARGAVELAPGVARIELNGLARGAERVPVTLWFASGAQVQLVVPVDGPKQPDPLE